MKTLIPVTESFCKYASPYIDIEKISIACKHSNLNAELLTAIGQCDWLNEIFFDSSIEDNILSLYIDKQISSTEAGLAYLIRHFVKSIGGEASVLHLFKSEQAITENLNLLLSNFSYKNRDTSFIIKTLAKIPRSTACIISCNFSSEQAIYVILAFVKQLLFILTIQLNENNNTLLLFRDLYSRIGFFLKVLTSRYPKQKLASLELLEKELSYNQWPFLNVEPVTAKLKTFYNFLTSDNVIKQEISPMLTRLYTEYDFGLCNFILSPDFDPSLSDSPLMSATLINPDVFNALGETISNDKRVVYKYYLGPFSTNDIYNSLLCGERPGEISYQDNPESRKKVHGIEVDPYARNLHDLGHAYTLLSFPEVIWKDLIPYLVKLLQSTGVNFSHAIWRLQDSAFTYCKSDLMAGHLQANSEYINIKYMRQILNEVFRDPDAGIDDKNSIPNYISKFDTLDLGLYLAFELALHPKPHTLSIHIDFDRFFFDNNYLLIKDIQKNYANEPTELHMLRYFLKIDSIQNTCINNVDMNQKLIQHLHWRRDEKLYFKNIQLRNYVLLHGRKNLFLHDEV